VFHHWLKFTSNCADIISTTIILYSTAVATFPTEEESKSKYIYMYYSFITNEIDKGWGLQIKMGVKEFLEKAMTDKRILAVIIVVAILWRTAISLDKEIAPWESICSGVAVIILGWYLFVYVYSLSRKQTSWLISNKMAQGIAISLVALNVYVLIYYGMRWFRLLQTEAYLPYDFLLRDVRYVMLVLAYCGIIWAIGYLRKMHDNYVLITEEMPEMRKPAGSEAFVKIITDDRTVIAIIGIAFFWRAFTSLDKQIAPWESMCSGVALIILGWALFGYINSLAMRTIRPSVAKIYHGIAIALFSMNIYVIAYYMMRWYRLAGFAGVEEVVVPLDFVFRDIRFCMIVIFYCTAIALSKYLERASSECEFLIKKGEKTYKE